MTRVVCAALLVALPSLVFAQPRLTPGPELDERLRLLEERRAPIDGSRSRALALRVTAGAGYALALGALMWTIAEVVAASNSKASGPLSGARPYTQVVPTLWTVAATIVFVAVAVTLHLSSRSLYTRADEEEADLEEELRVLRPPAAACAPE